MSETRLLQVGAVTERVGISRAQIYKLMAAGRFPRPLDLGGKVRRWRSDELDDWIEQRTAARDGNGAD